MRFAPDATLGQVDTAAKARVRAAMMVDAKFSSLTPKSGKQLADQSTFSTEKRRLPGRDTDAQARDRAAIRMTASVIASFR